MLVLGILGSFLLLALAIWGIIRFDAWVARKRGGFRVLGWKLLLMGGGADLLIYFGYRWYEKSLYIPSGDPLNGIVLMIFGALLYGAILIIDIRNAGWWLGPLCLLVQIPVFAAVAVVGVLIAILGLSALSQARPVYTLNDPDD